MKKTVSSDTPEPVDPNTTNPTADDADKEASTGIPVIVIVVLALFGTVILGCAIVIPTHSDFSTGFSGV